jgi:hypothetical protein
MWGFSEYRNTGTWPSIFQNALQVSETQINDFTIEAIKHADQSKKNQCCK